MLKIFMALCGVIVLLGGIAQIWKGVKTMRGGNSPEFTALVEQSDKAAQEGNRHADETQPLFQQIMTDIDKVGLPQVRAEQRELATRAADGFGKAVERFAFAGKKLEESEALNKHDRLKPFLEKQAKSYSLFAQMLQVNQEMIGMVLDESIGTVDALLPKLNEAAARRTALKNEATAAGAEASEIGKQIRAAAGK